MLLPSDYGHNLVLNSLSPNLSLRTLGSTVGSIDVARLNTLGERTGCLHVVLNNAEPAKNVQGQIGRIVRAMYSNPPSFGAAIVRIVLSDPALFDV